ncbi:high light inducible protein [Leptolyngbya sp. FACHB-261]|uniref:high light inducible protein n=1 Tax=Leptolyngbya sp. FACHB-261 TaxID=2692806 RepID=UPI0018EF60F1|nr:high light inducible protein [Leptolyngbya sp. FACHB-261]
MPVESLKNKTFDQANTPTVDPLDPNHSRNAWRWGSTPQAELWNGRFAMLGYVAYMYWDLAGASVLRDVLHLIK